MTRIYGFGNQQRLGNLAKFWELDGVESLVLKMLNGYNVGKGLGKD